MALAIACPASADRGSGVGFVAGDSARLGSGAITGAAAAAGGVIGNETGAFAIGAAGPIALQAIIARTTVVAPPQPEPERPAILVRRANGKVDRESVDETT